MNAEEFFEATKKRASESVAFVLVASEQPELNAEQRMWVEVGISLGITSAIDECHQRGWLKAPGEEQ